MLLGSKVQIVGSIFSKARLEQTVLKRFSSTMTNTLTSKKNMLCCNLDLLNYDANFSSVGKFLTSLANI